MNLKKFSAKAGMATLLFASAVSATAQKPFTVNGQLGKDQQGMMYLNITSKTANISDSTRLVEGKFSFKGTITEAAHSGLVLKPVDPNGNWQFREFYLEPTTITINSDSDLNVAKITGGPAQVDFTTLMNDYIPIGIEGSALDKQMAQYKEEGNEEKQKEVYAKMLDLKLKRREVQKAFIRSHPNSEVAFSVWMRGKDGFLDPKEVEPEFLKFSPSVRNNADGKRIAERLSVIKKLLPGNIAPDFTLNDVDGKPVSLSGLKGKNVFLCFWSKNFIPFEPFTFAMNRISRQLKAENMVMLLVYYEATDRNDWQSILSEIALNSPNIIHVKDPVKLGNYEDRLNSKVKTSYDLFFGATPVNYLISPNGEILARDINLDKDPVTSIKALLK